MGRNTGHYSDPEENLSIDTGSIVTMLMEVSLQPGPTAVPFQGNREVYVNYKLVWPISSGFLLNNSYILN